MEGAVVGIGGALAQRVLDRHHAAQGVKCEDRLMSKGIVEGVLAEFRRIGDRVAGIGPHREEEREHDQGEA